MRACAGSGLLVALTLAASSACEVTDLSDLHPDAVALAVLLVAGESEARLLAVHPHRQPGDAAPEITASLEGPGWKAAFSETLDLEACGGLLPGPFPSRCLGAVPPEALRPGVGYGLHGTTPLGSFTGELKLPTLPLLLEPADTLRLPKPAGSGRISIPIRYQVGSDSGTLLSAVLDYFVMHQSGEETELQDRYQEVDRGGTEATVSIFQYELGVRFSLRLLGIGWHYTDFVKHMDMDHPLLRPWPSFGIEGEGVYGYFDGVTPSRAAQVLVR